MRALRLSLLFTIFIVAGCASPINHRADFKNIDPASPRWQGRLALTVRSVPVQSLAAGFELHGTAQAGTLGLYSALGTTLALLAWDGTAASLQQPGASPQHFASLADLTLAATGASLPIDSLFAWLHGNDAQTEGWRTDLQELPVGRLRAWRYDPAPAVELTVILER